MRSYNDALRLYNGITTPPRSNYWRNLTFDNAKPLNGTGQRHKSIHMTDDGAIYFKLYNTKIATFVPNDDNTYTVIMQYYSSPTTNKFMFEYGLHYGYLTGMHNAPARIPYFHSSGMSASAILTFDSETDALITDPKYSWHPVIATRVVADKDKSNRKLVRAKMKPYVDIATFSAQDNIAKAINAAHQSYAHPFFSLDDVYSANSAIHPLKFIDNTIQRWVRDWRIREGDVNYSVFPFDDDHFVDKFIEAVPAMLTLYISRKADKVQVNEWHDHRVHTRWDECLEHARRDFDVVDFTKSVERQIMRSFQLDVGSGFKPYPLFVKSLPRKYVCHDFKCPEHLVNKFRKHI